jgi:hypothetical protein
MAKRGSAREADARYEMGNALRTWLKAKGVPAATASVDRLSEPTGRIDLGGNLHLEHRQLVVSVLVKEIKRGKERPSTRPVLGAGGGNNDQTT